MAKLSLLEQAKNNVEKLRGPQKKYSKEELDLALAWANGEVTLGQIRGVMNNNSQGTYTFLARALRQLITETKETK